MSTFRIQTVIDECTPEVCLIANGRIWDKGDIPHDTGDPKNLCRCVAVQEKWELEEEKKMKFERFIKKLLNNFWFQITFYGMWGAIGAWLVLRDK